ncbi:MAG: hypothetical protein N2316_10575 [Spirochaetes bacterium]|nr:hypothetical protein [Spirochaetota bacterium]
MMNCIANMINCTIAVYCIYTIIRRMFRPEEAYEYTRMLLFSGLGTIPIVFFTMMCTGKTEVFNAFAFSFLAGLRMGAYFLVLTSMISRLILDPNEELMITAGIQIALFFICMYITIGLVQVMTKYFGGTGEQETHFLHIWPDCRTAVSMFFLDMHICDQHTID